MKGDKMAKRSSFGSMVRRRLSDITNSLPQPKSPSFPEKLELDNAYPMEYIDHLLKEKMVLVKLIQEKNNIIEMSGIEIQNLRACLQKMQLQNWTLAQTNSILVAEVNAGKRRLKALQHDVACRDTLLNAKNLQHKVKEEVNVQTNVVKGLEELTEESEMDADATRRRHLSRSASLGSSTTSQKRADKEAAVSKRRCLRRQSSACLRTRSNELTSDNLFELDIDVKSLAEMEDEARRASVSRPLRKAVEKVQSYKEKPLNIKMRRPQ